MTIDYETFLKIRAKLKTFILNNNGIMCSPNKIRKHLIPDLAYCAAQNITQHYRLYMKSRYTLDRLILMIILYKYSSETVFENYKWEKQKVKTLPIKRDSMKYLIHALEKFLLD